MQGVHLSASVFLLTGHGSKDESCREFFLLRVYFYQGSAINYHLQLITWSEPPLVAMPPEGSTVDFVARLGLRAGTAPGRWLLRGPSALLFGGTKRIVSRSETPIENTEDLCKSMLEHLGPEVWPEQGAREWLYSTTAPDCPLAYTENLCWTTHRTQ